MKPLLSIGLIVKNEEETLTRCLDSLKLLQEELNAELIVTDTGSTDQTVEIARKYTDQVYSFEWCGDFSAARNAGIKKANGRWFMAIDADEWIDDPKEIISFFKSGEYKKYKAASYHIHSYVDSAQKAYTESTAIRLFDKASGLRYQGTIHEYLPILKDVKVLDCFAHHTGYTQEDEKKQRKHGRNLELLLEESRKEPDNERVLYLLLNQYAFVSDWDSLLACKARVLDLIRKNADSNFRHPIYKTLIWASVESKQLTEAVELANEYFALNKQVYMSDLDIWYLMTDTYLQMGSVDDAATAAEKYLALYEDFHNGKLKNIDVFSGSMLSIDGEYYRLVARKVFERLVSVYKYKQALLLFQKVNLERLAEIKKDGTFWSMLLVAAAAAHQENAAEGFCRKILDLKVMEERREAVDCFLTCVAELTDRDHYGAVLENLTQKCTGLTVLLYETYSQYPFSSGLQTINKDFFVLNIFELLLSSYELDFNCRRRIFDIYIEQSCVYIKLLYNPAFFNGDYIKALPQKARFFYFAQAARVEKSDAISYLRELIQAARMNVMVVPFIKEWLAQEEESLKHQSKEEAADEPSEFEQLGIKVKEQIRSYIEMARFEEAAMVLEQYKGINKEDPEIVLLEEQLNAKM